MMANNPLPEWHDMQGLVLSGYPHLGAAEYVPLRIGKDVALTKNWLRRMAGRVTTATARPHMATQAFTGTFGRRVKANLNIAISFRGLKKLWRLTRAERNRFPIPFVEGIAGNDHRSRILGDTSRNKPQDWYWGGNEKEKRVDVLLMVYAPDDVVRERAVNRAIASSGMTRVPGAIPLVGTPSQPPDPAAPDADFREHFGFVDGISQPILTGTADAERFSDSIHVTELGEFVLGYPNNDRQIAPALTLAGFDFSRNGSFLVLRQLAQDVEAFETFTKGDPLLGPKMVGRQKDGTPLIPGGHKDINEFDYSGDRHGLGCPVGAHIRRSHPRGSLSKEPFDRERVNTRRLLRRGRSYGPRWANDTAGDERGLVFLVLNADIERQFEFINMNWVNNTGFSGLYDERDPVLGPHWNGSTFTIPAEPARRRVTGLQDFVQVKGGEYFFLPGIRALKRLAGAI